MEFIFSKKKYEKITKIIFRGNFFIFQKTKVEMLSYLFIKFRKKNVDNFLVLFL